MLSATVTTKTSDCNADLSQTGEKAEHMHCNGRKNITSSWIMSFFAVLLHMSSALHGLGSMGFLSFCG